MRVRDNKCFFIILISFFVSYLLIYKGSKLAYFDKRQSFKPHTAIPVSPNESNKLQNSLENSDSKQFNQFWKKWRNMLVFDVYDKKNKAVVNFVEALSKKANDVNEKLNKSSDRDDLWAVEAGDTPSAHFTTRFHKLLTLTLAFGTNGTSFYRNPEVLQTIREGLKSMVTKYGYDGRQSHGNWWDFQIGAPHAFIDILMVLREELNHYEVAMYTEVISNYVPNPSCQMNSVNGQGLFVDITFHDVCNTTGANRADLALTVLALGILQEDSKKVQSACYSIKPLVSLVTKSDGFYADGSFIQHSYVPQTGSYGSVLVKSLSKLLYIVKDSEVKINSNIVEMFMENIEKAFIPLLHNGRMLHMSIGRSISRYPVNKNVGYGIQVLYILLLASEIAPYDRGRKLKETVKYWMNKNPEYYLEKAEEYIYLLLSLSLLSDTTIAGDRLQFSGTKMYASMDRFVQRTSNYVVSLALYSYRIAAFEAGNKENKKGWHTADGMLYLYNDDQVQFNDSYWPTVDPYRLPGTTVDTVKLKDEVSFFLYACRSEEKWVGGVSNDDQAVVGMSLNKRRTKNNDKDLPMNLRAKKSWFVVNGLVVALGAGISGDTRATIETIVDNRLLNDRYNYQVLISNNLSSTEGRFNWLLLEADPKQVSVGYFFPQNETVFITKERRTGYYTEINEFTPNFHNYTGTYFKCLIKHGSNPRNGTYAYVLLPGIDRNGIMNLSKKGTVNILANTGDIQAVELKEHGYLGINVWAEKGGAVGGISVDQPVSFLRQRKGNLTTYTASDPTQTDRVTCLKVPKDFVSVVSMSEGVTFDGVQTFRFDFTQAAGAGKTVIVK